MALIFSINCVTKGVQLFIIPALAADFRAARRDNGCRPSRAAQPVSARVSVAAPSGPGAGGRGSLTTSGLGESLPGAEALPPPPPPPPPPRAPLPSQSRDSAPV